jgi:hypothetical protein
MGPLDRYKIMSESFHNLKNTASLVRQQLLELGRMASTFSAKTGISCLSGCGACCAKPHGVWATPAEMLPMAFQLFNEGRTAETLLQAVEAGDPRVCIAYEPENSSGQQGRCGRYDLRPPVCILFGSGLRKTKHGRHEFIGCSWQRTMMANAIAAVESGPLDAQNEAGSLTSQIRSLSPDPKLAVEAPINIALIQALELIEFNSQFI